MGVTTDSIKAQSKYDVKVKKHEQKEKAKLEEARKEQERNRAAADLVNSLSGYSDEAKARKIRGDIKDNLKEMYKDGQITKEEYKAAKSYANSGEYKDKLQSELNSSARVLVASVAGKADGTKIGDIKDEVRDALKEKLDNGEITQAEYDNAKKYTKTGLWIGRVFGKKRESRDMFQTRQYQNHLVQTKQEGPEIDAKLKAKLNIADISVDEVYEIARANGGGEILEDGRVNGDATINYSYKKKQPGEMDAVLTAFNNNDAGVKFTKKETNEILKQAGFHVEKKINMGKALETGLKTAIPVSPVELAKISSTATSSAIAEGSVQAGANGAAKASIASGGVVTGAAFLIGTGVSMYNQAHRVEDRAIPTNVPEGVTTYEQYAKYLDDNYSTAKGAALGKDIAKQFVKDGKLDVEGLNKALQTTAGTIASTSTPLNKREAYGLLMSAASQEKPAPDADVKVVKEPETCEVVVEKDEIKEVKPEETDCYTVKAGDNWSAVVVAKYAPKNGKDHDALVRKLKDAYFEANKEKLTKQGIKSSYGAFFAKVGEDLCLPSTLTINGTTYTFNNAAKVNGGTVSNDYKGALIEGGANIFTKTVTNPIFYGRTCDGKEFVASTEEGIVKTVEELQKENQNKKYVIVK